MCCSMEIPHDRLFRHIPHIWQAFLRVSMSELRPKHCFLLCFSVCISAATGIFIWESTKTIAGAIVLKKYP